MASEPFAESGAIRIPQNRSPRDGRSGASWGDLRRSGVTLSSIEGLASRRVVFGVGNAVVNPNRYGHLATGAIPGDSVTVPELEPPVRGVFREGAAPIALWGSPVGCGNVPSPPAL